jgi:hypothetical protein
MALKFRRGTTAQQSGSLAYGEPYVNTDLGTLLVGGASGDIQLSNTGPTSTFAGASVSASTFVSASTLKVTGNASIDGNLTLGGNITIGDNASDTVNVTAALSSSLIPQTTNAFDLGSSSKIWRDLYISTGSIKFVEGTTVVKTLSAATLTALETSTGSANASIISLNSFSASTLGHITDINTKTGSFETKFATLQTLTASMASQVSRIQESTASLNTFSGSTLTRLSRIEESTASLNSLTSSYARTNVANIFTANQTITGSLYISQDLVVAGSSSIQNISSSRLDIGDNIIQLNVNSPSLRFGGLAINDSGSAGSSGSFLYDSVEDEFIFVHKGNGTNVTSSHFVLGPETYDNLGNETYLTQNKVVKGGGYEHIVDSNITDTGTLITLGSNTVVTGTLLASGTALVSGSAQIDHNSTTNYVANKHIDHTSVQISAGNGLSGGGDISSTRTLALDTTSATFTTGVKSKLDVDGVISGSKTITIAGTSTALGSSITAEQIRTAIGTVVTGSSQIVGSSITTNTVTVGSTAIALGGSATTIAGLSSVTSTGFTGALTGNASTATTLQTARTINGTSFNGSADITIANLVSGSSQITLSSTTGYGTVINQNLLTTSNVQYASLGIGMAASGTSGRIDAANDVVAFSSSDIRFKENIKPIENALDKISNISGNTYDWKVENKAEHGYEGNDVGVIAQEIEEVLPQLVQTRENGYKAVKYDKLVALLIEGIKEQQLTISKLELQVNGLQNVITIFEDRMKEKGLL